MRRTPSFHPTPRYHVHNVIGQGGSGSVFRAWDTRLSCWVALKRLTGNGEKSEANSEQVFHEAMVLAALPHPNIVTVYDYGMDQEGPFVVMELLDGENLEQVIGRAAFLPAEFAQVVRSTLEGVMAFHQAGLIHRDLKPGNLMLTRSEEGEWQVKILDFGLARFLSPTPSPTVESDGRMIGSIFTMAPEQLNRQPLDVRTDLYALGCIFYYALAGRYPFDGETVQDVVIAHLQHHVTALEEMRRDLPPAWSGWVMRLICLDRNDRYESACAALQVFNEIAMKG